MTAPKPQRVSAADAVARGGAMGDRLQSGVGVGTKQELKWHLICNAVAGVSVCVCMKCVACNCVCVCVCVCLCVLPASSRSER